MNERILHLLRTSPEGETPRLGALRRPLPASESGWAGHWARSKPRWKSASMPFDRIHGRLRSRMCYARWQTVTLRPRRSAPFDVG